MKTYIITSQFKEDVTWHDRYLTSLSWLYTWSFHFIYALRLTKDKRSQLVWRTIKCQGIISLSLLSVNPVLHVCVWFFFVFFFDFWFFILVFVFHSHFLFFIFIFLLSLQHNNFDWLCSNFRITICLTQMNVSYVI